MHQSLQHTTQLYEQGNKDTRMIKQIHHKSIWLNNTTKQQSFPNIY